MKFNNKVISRDEIEIILSSTNTANKNYVIDAEIIELKAENLPSKINLKRFGMDQSKYPIISPVFEAVKIYAKPTDSRGNCSQLKQSY